MNLVLCECKLKYKIIFFNKITNLEVFLIVYVMEKMNVKSKELQY